jgi:hypothetical protein
MNAKKKHVFSPGNTQREKKPAAEIAIVIARKSDRERREPVTEGIHRTDGARSEARSS